MDSSVRTTQPVEEREMGPLEAKWMKSQAFRNVAQQEKITSTQWHAAIVGGLSWGFDAMDGAILAVTTAFILAEFNMPLQAMGDARFWWGIVGYAGALLWPWLADRYGRRTILTITVVGYSVLTGVVGLSSSWTFFFVAYAMLTIPLRGEWPVGAALTAECWPPRRRGFALAFARSGYGAGAGIAGILLATIVGSFGWRSAFFFGIIPALFSFYIRFTVPETPYFVRLQDRRSRIKQALASGQKLSDEDADWHKKASSFAWLQLFHRGMPMNTFAALWIAAAEMIPGGLWAGWLPYYLTRDLHYDNVAVGSIWTIANWSGMFGYWVVGWLQDWIGRKWTFTITLLISAVLFLSWSSFKYDSIWIVGILITLTGFVWLGQWGTYGAYLTEVFPTRVRATGTGFVLAVTAIASTILQPYITQLATWWGSFQIWWWICVGLFILQLLVMWPFAPEPKGRELDEIAV